MFPAFGGRVYAKNSLVYLMKMKITGKARSRKASMRGFLRWLSYAAVLLLFYVMECNPIIPKFSPLLLIPLATAVAMHEGDLAAGVFGVFCGLMLDIANGVAIVGFSALLLLAACPLISLVSRFLIKKTFISHLILNTAAAVIMAVLDLIFLHWIWEGTQSVISFRKVILPAYGGAIFWSIPIYALVSFISGKFRPKEQQRLSESAQNNEEQELDG